MKTIERKQDTRKKIQLGGLIKKAGLAEENAIVLFGLLLDAAEELKSINADELRKRWQLRGERGLLN